MRKTFFATIAGPVEDQEIQKGVPDCYGLLASLAVSRLGPSVEGRWRNVGGGEGGISFIIPRRRPAQSLSGRAVRTRGLFGPRWILLWLRWRTRGVGSRDFWLWGGLVRCYSRKGGWSGLWRRGSRGWMAWMGWMWWGWRGWLVPRWRREKSGKRPWLLLLWPAGLMLEREMAAYSLLPFCRIEKKYNRTPSRATRPKEFHDTPGQPLFCTDLHRKFIEACHNQIAQNLYAHSKIAREGNMPGRLWISSRSSDARDRIM